MPKKKSAPKSASSPSCVVVDLSVPKEGLEPILGAAYLMTDRAFVSLEGDRVKTITVSLTLKEPATAAGLKALKECFTRELATQKVRWAISKNNQPIREYIAEQAVLLANGRLEPAAAAPAAPADEQLTKDQRAEIEKLIAEVEDEIKAMNQKKAVPDPKNIKASWEEKQEAKLREGGKA
ncbi:MAG: hypothetical protein HY077_16440 [Elusimicrobia bacterium]|nr:hypothetical protein [Elusimicrobiota bacterium]